MITKNVIFLIDSKIDINLLNKKTLQYKSNNVIFFALNYESQIFLKENKIQYFNTEQYFNNSDHKRIVLHLDKVRTKIRKNIYLKTKYKEFTSFSKWYSNMIIFTCLSYPIFLIEVILNIIKKHKPSIIITFSTSVYSNRIGYKDISIIEFIASMVCKAKKINYIKYTNEISSKKKSILNNKIKKNKHFKNISLKSSILLLSIEYNMIETVKILKKIAPNKKIFLISSENSLFKKLYYLFKHNIRLLFLDQNFLSNFKINILKKNDIPSIATYRNIDLSYLVENKILADLNTSSNRISSQLFHLTKLLSISNPDLIISPHSFGLSGVIGDISNFLKLNAISISHGTVNKPRNSIDKIINQEIGESVILNNYPMVLAQTKLSLNFLKFYKSKSQVISSGPVIFSKIKKSITDSRTILHASTFKNKNNMKFWGVETYDEYLSSLLDLCDVTKKLNFKLIIKPHPSLIEEISLDNFKELVGDHSHIEITNNSFSDCLSKSDLLISYSSTTIEEALINNKYVILYDKWLRYRHCKSYRPKPNANVIDFPVYYIHNKSLLLNSLNQIYKFALDKKSDFTDFLINKKSTKKYKLILKDCIFKNQ